MLVRPVEEGRRIAGDFEVLRQIGQSHARTGLPKSVEEMVLPLKDMTVRKGAPIMAEIGEGNMNWPSILDACKRAGVEWYIVEQDVCQRDPFESLAISLRNLKEMGLA